MCSWNKEQTIALLDFHCSMECLYNGRHHDYLNKKKKKECWQEISSLMQKWRPGTTVQEVKLKIKILRSQFLSEESRIKQSKKDGSGIEDIYTPKLWCYNNLKYLENINNTLRRESTAGVLCKTDKNSSRISNIFSTPTTTTKEVGEEDPVELKTYYLSQSAMATVKEATGRKNSSIRAFLNFLEQELSKLDQDTLQETKWQILDYVKEAQQQSKYRNSY